MSVQETYEATQAQQQQIHNDIKDSQALISELLPLSSLERDFEGHDIYLSKLKVLMTRYKNMRRVRGDGNCFFRSFGFAFLESIVVRGEPALFDRLKERCTVYKDHLIAQGYSEFTVQDFAEQFMEMIDTVRQTTDSKKLEELFNDQGYSDYYIVFLRLIVSSFLQIHVDFYRDFIDDGLTMKQFCEREVEPMYVESDNIHITALSRSLLVNVNVEVCQNSGDVNRHTFSPELEDLAGVVSAASAEGASAIAGDLASLPTVYLLYRPGHYDVLYDDGSAV